VVRRMVVLGLERLVWRFALYTSSILWLMIPCYEFRMLFNALIPGYLSVLACPKPWPGAGVAAATAPRTRSCSRSGLSVAASLAICDSCMAAYRHLRLMLRRESRGLEAGEEQQLAEQGRWSLSWLSGPGHERTDGRRLLVPTDGALAGSPRLV